MTVYVMFRYQNYETIAGLLDPYEPATARHVTEWQLCDGKKKGRIDR